MASETTVVPGNPPSWREFAIEDYDPEAEREDDALTALAAERTDDDPFGIVVVIGPVDAAPDALIKRLAAMMIPTRVRRESREESKPGEKKKPKDKGKDKGKDKDDD
jgi:hypothetical protein